MLITSGKIRISTNLPISLCRHLRISLYLQPLVNKKEQKQKKVRKKPKFNIRCSKYSRQIVSPGSAHIPRNCGHPTMDSGNLKTNENQYQQGDICLCPCQQEHVDIHTAFKLIKTYQEMCSGVSSSSPTSSSDEESNSLVLISSAPP